MFGSREPRLVRSSCVQVKLVGEGADDAGGVFDDTITEMCGEIISGHPRVLIPTPNAVNDVGFNRDAFMLNPGLKVRSPCSLTRSVVALVMVL